MSASPEAVYGPKVAFCDQLHAQKYRSEGESFADAMSRVAHGLQDSEEHCSAFRDILLDMRFMPAGRIQAATGSQKNVTGINCFVLPIEDSFVDGPDSIMEAATNAATTMRMGGGCGYDFSRLRPRGALIKKLQSKSSGPVSFMEIFDAVCRATSSSGHRRGAQMAILRCDHPSILEFVSAKQNQTRLTGFNTSVAITDEFMQAVVSDKPFDLRWHGDVYETVSATALWDEIMRSTWDWAEPGVFFIDQVNRMNNLYFCETLEACNPCQEQGLPPFGACLLGSFNLAKYVLKGYFDQWQFHIDIPQVVRAMDNVIDRTMYPLPQQQKEALSKRRMGLGITGLANAAEALGFAYGSPEFLRFEEGVLDILANECYKASALLAKEKGAFPLYDKDKYLAGKFIQTLRDDTQALIARHGIRNSHLTSIAPTGTISLCADNVSSGIEPVFEYEFDRTVIEFEGPRKMTVKDYGLSVFGVRGKRAQDVTVKEHVDVLVTAQKHIDSAVSKTCNVASSVSWEDFKGVYMDAWQRGAKGCSTFRVGGRRTGVLEAPAEGSACYIDAAGKKVCGD